MSVTTVRRTLATLTAGALLAAPVAVLTSAPASADVERNGTCGRGTYELNVDREGRGFEVGVDLDQIAPGAAWRVVIRHEGRVVADTVRRADREGDIEVERYRAGTPGKDTFSFRATRVGTKAACGATLTTR